MAESAVERFVLGIYDHRANTSLFHQARDAVRLFLRRQVGHRNVACAIRQGDHQRHHLRMPAQFANHDLVRHQQTGRERRLAADWNRLERFLR